VSGVVADTSVWIEFFAGREARSLERALADSAVVVPPLVVAELLSGVLRKRDREAVHELLAEIPLHETPFEHWARVGSLRSALRRAGLSVSTPDAHVAQCALDRDAVLLTRDRIFSRIARATKLRVAA
jgi:predicted nucleic acid-binding protein